MNIEICVDDYMKDATDRERIALIKRILETVKEEGVIEKIRALVMEEAWND